MQALWVMGMICMTTVLAQPRRSRLVQSLAFSQWLAAALLRLLLLLLQLLTQGVLQLRIHSHLVAATTTTTMTTMEMGMAFSISVVRPMLLPRLALLLQ